MIHAQHAMPAEPDDDAGRLLAASREATALVVHALANVSLPAAERALIVVVRRSMAEHPLNRREMHNVMRVAWRHRRKLPAHLAPKINPDDPLAPERMVAPDWKDHPHV